MSMNIAHRNFLERVKRLWEALPEEVNLMGYDNTWDYSNPLKDEHQSQNESDASSTNATRLKGAVGGQHDNEETMDTKDVEDAVAEFAANRRIKLEGAKWTITSDGQLVLTPTESGQGNSPETHTADLLDIHVDSDESIDSIRTSSRASNSLSQGKSTIIGPTNTSTKPLIQPPPYTPFPSQGAIPKKRAS